MPTLSVRLVARDCCHHCMVTSPVWPGLVILSPLKEEDGCMTSNNPVPRAHRGAAHCSRLFPPGMRNSQTSKFSRVSQECRTPPESLSSMTDTFPCCLAGDMRMHSACEVGLFP